MGDMAEVFSAMKDHRKKLRATYGVECPQCKIVRPKAHPTILMPQQRCKVDGYKDNRPYLTSEQHQAIEQAHGIGERYE
jgi:hypothetical protein